MILVLENLAGVYIASHVEELRRNAWVTLVGSNISGYIDKAYRVQGGTIDVPRPLLRWVKLGLSLFGMPIAQQDVHCLAFRINSLKWLISDGLMTEYLVERQGATARRFFSLTDVHHSDIPVVPGCAIIGSNWVEFGMMSEASYERHLDFLNSRYPEALYYCHPKEKHPAAERIFGTARTMRPSRPLESILRATGVPRHLVSVCSSSLLSLASGNEGKVSVDLINLNHGEIDGPTGEVLTTTKNGSGELFQLTLGELQNFLATKLSEMGVETRRYEQVPHDPYRHK